MSHLNLTRFKAWFETKKRTRDADWAGTYHCEVKNLVGGAVSRNVTVSSAYIRKNFLRDPRNGLLLFTRWSNSQRPPRIILELLIFNLEPYLSNKIKILILKHDY